MKRIVFTVTNDLSFDQRMQRICKSLSKAGYNVLLVGRKHKHSLPLQPELYQQKRLTCKFNKGMLFYAEYNVRLLYYLLFIHIDVLCAIDLDTILPCYIVSKTRNIKRVYDAHELFTEMKEVIKRPHIRKQWIKIERLIVPKFQYGYTVSQSIADEFKKRYKVNYAVIRNMPYKKFVEPRVKQQQIIFLYQGAVNEARGLENLVLSMKQVDALLHMYGDGNIFKKIKKLVSTHQLEHKVILKGKVLPETLDAITPQYYLGINLVEPVGLNQIYSLANKFFDYIQAEIPQLAMNFPEYKNINDDYEVAVLINTVHEDEITAALELLIDDDVYYNTLKANCITAKESLTWQQEEKKLLHFYEVVCND